MQKIHQSRKFIVAVVGVAITYALAHYGNNDALLNDVVLVATALGVYVVPNRPQ